MPSSVQESVVSEAGGDEEEGCAGAVGAVAARAAELRTEVFVGARRERRGGTAGATARG